MVIMKPFTVNLVVISAKGLKSNTGKHRFCVHAKVGRNKQKTNVIEDLFGNPSFNKEFTFTTDNLKNELKLKVTEKNDKDVLGQVVIQLSDLCHDRIPNPERAPLRAHKKSPQPSGEILFDAWVTGVTPSNLNLAKTSASNESLKSLGSSGFKKLKEKLHASALRLNPLKDDKSDVKKSHLSIFSGKSKGMFGSKNKTSMSCQDLSGPLNFQPKQKEKVILGSYKLSSEDMTQLGSGASSRKSSEDSTRSFSQPPEITGVSPNTADCRGGAVLTIRGSNLGKDPKDVLQVYICGFDMTNQVKYISSQKLLCTTAPCSPSKGNVAVITQSGGFGSSTLDFSFYGTPETRSLNDSPISQNSDKVFAGNNESSPVSKPTSDPSHLPSPPPRFNRRPKELGVIKESSQDDCSESSGQEGMKKHKKNSSLSRSSIFLSINQSPPSQSKRLSLFSTANDDLDHQVQDLVNPPVQVTNGVPSVGKDPKDSDEIGNAKGSDENGNPMKFNFENHDFSTPEGIRMFYNHSDTGLAERLSEYYQTQTEAAVEKPEPVLESVPVVTKSEEEPRPYNKHLSNVFFSIGGDTSSDDESVKKLKVLPQNHSKSSLTDIVSSSKNSSDADISGRLISAPKTNDVAEASAMQAVGKQVVEIQPISRQLDGVSNLSKEDSRALHIPAKMNSKSQVPTVDSEVSSPKFGSPSYAAPVKPPRIRALSELNLLKEVPSDSTDGAITPARQLIKARVKEGSDNDDDNNGDDSEDDENKERVKKLEEEVYAKEISLQELRAQNKVLQEERNLLRRYIEVLISRALTTCPEILCSDGGHISLG